MKFQPHLKEHISQSRAILSLIILQKKANLSLKMKVLLFILIATIICLTAGIVLVIYLCLKTVDYYKNEISDHETEKRVLEFQKEKLNKTVINLTDSNNNLNVKNLDLNDKLNKVASDEIVRN